MRNEDLFILFLQDWESSDSVGEATRERAKFRLARAMKNRRGTLAADFRFVDRQGRETTLFKSLGNRCHTPDVLRPRLPPMRGDQEGHRRLSGGGRRQGSGNRHSLAIAYCGTRQKPRCRLAWTVGYALDPLEEEETYVFPASRPFTSSTPQDGFSSKTRPSTSSSTPIPWIESAESRGLRSPSPSSRKDIFYKCTLKGKQGVGRRHFRYSQE